MRLNKSMPRPSASAYLNALVNDEIGRLVHALNDAFNRLERSFAQATRFSSDASH